MLKKTVGVMVGMLVFTALAWPADRWLHIRVIESDPEGDRVRVNIPLSLAEAVLPTIHSDKFWDGRVRLEDHDFNQVDLRAVLAAVRNAQDNQYVTVQSRDQNVEVAKSGEFLLIKVHEKCRHGAKTDRAGKAEHTVDVKVPFKVASALLSGPNDELNVLAAVRALDEFGNLELVTVKDDTTTSASGWIRTMPRTERLHHREHSVHRAGRPWGAPWSLCSLWWWWFSLRLTMRPDVCTEAGQKGGGL